MIGLIIFLLDSLTSSGEKGVKNLFQMTELVLIIGADKHVE
jgi:hypothetical protein